MEVVSKKVTIGDKVYSFRPNFRSFIEYERIAGKSVGLIDGMEDSAKFLYSGIKAGMKYEKKEFNIEFEDFIDMLDDIDVLNILGDDEKTSEKKVKDN